MSVFRVLKRYFWGETVGNYIDPMKMFLVESESAGKDALIHEQLMINNEKRGGGYVARLCR